MPVSDFEVLEAALRSAGTVLMDFFGQQLDRTYKTTPADFRTQADVAAEEIIISAIERNFPEYNISAEEHGETDKGSRYTFVIDPLDGTNNFVLGIPAFVTNLALLEGMETVYGAVYHPVTGNLYYATKGGGAFLNGTPIEVNSEDREGSITVSYYCNYTTPKERVVQFKSTLLRLGIQRSLDLWAPGFCFCGLASGRLEAVVNDGTELYDYAAGRLIALEAGGKITDFHGNPDVADHDGLFLLTNGTSIHEMLVENLTSPLARH